MPDPQKQWRPLELVKVTAQYLAQKKIEGARLDAEVLLAEVLHCSRLGVYAQPDTVLTPAQVDAYREFVRRRTNHEPVSRILGKKEFMGMEFTVTPAVLSPRPETEILVEQALKILDPSPKKKKSDVVFAALESKMREFVVQQTAADRGALLPAELLPLLDASPVAPAEAAPVDSATPAALRVLDLGTGSGCIAVSLAKSCPRARVFAVDSSSEALATARANAEKLGAAVEFFQGDWFAALPAGERFDVIVSNPPYIVDGDPELEPEVRDYDPAGALFGGADGLDAYRKITARAGEFLAPGGCILFEVGQGQAPAVQAMLLKQFPDASVECAADYAGIERVVCARLS